MIGPNMPTPRTNAADRTDSDHRLREERQRDNRLGGCRLGVQSPPSMTVETTNSDTTRAAPQPVLRRPCQREQQRHDPTDQRRESGPVQHVSDAARCHVRELEVNRRHRDGAKRQVDVKAGAPRPVVGQPAAERRTENRRNTPQRGEQSLVCPRSIGEKMSPTMVKRMPTTIPPPTPCRPRNTISWPMPSVGRNVNSPAAPQAPTRPRTASRRA